MAGALVLVIDDDERLRELYRLNLEMRGFTVADAANGEDGLESARKVRPSVIVLDLTMPGTDGWAVLKALKDDPGLADTPVVVLTGHTDEEIEDRARAAGAVAFVAKPVDTDDFVRVLSRYAPD